MSICVNKAFAAVWIPLHGKQTRNKRKDKAIACKQCFLVVANMLKL